MSPGYSNLHHITISVSFEKYRKEKENKAHKLQYAIPYYCASEYQSHKQIKKGKYTCINIIQA